MKYSQDWRLNVKLQKRMSHFCVQVNLAHIICMGRVQACPGEHRVVVALPFSWVIQIIAECLSMRKLIVQCSHIAFVHLYIVSISVLHGQVGTCSITMWLVGSALPASDSAQSAPVCGSNFCWYNTMELELNQSTVWTRRDLQVIELEVSQCGRANRMHLNFHTKPHLLLSRRLARAWGKCTAHTFSYLYYSHMVCGHSVANLYSYSALKSHHHELVNWVDH